MWYQGNLEELLRILGDVEHSTTLSRWQPSKPMQNILSNNYLGKLLLINRKLIYNFWGATVTVDLNNGYLAEQWVLENKLGAKA